MRRSSRKGVALFSRIQNTPSRAKYLISYKDTVVEFLAKAFEAVKEKAIDTPSR